MGLFPRYKIVENLTVSRIYYHIEERVLGIFYVPIWEKFTTDKQTFNTISGAKKFIDEYDLKRILIRKVEYRECVYFYKTLFGIKVKFKRKFKIVSTITRYGIVNDDKSERYFTAYVKEWNDVGWEPIGLSKFANFESAKNAIDNHNYGLIIESKPINYK